MTRRSDQLTRIEQALARLEQTVTVHTGRFTETDAALRAGLRDARASADAALAGVQALATVKTGPDTPQTAAGGDTGTTGEPVTARRAPKTLKPKDQI
jgi:hypothetical protein